LAVLFAGLLANIGGYTQAPISTTDCRYHIHGIVYDQNRKPVLGAAIYVAELAKGNVTNELGDYTIDDLCIGNYTLICSYVGYETDTAIVSIAAGRLVVEQNFKLQETGIELGEVIITEQKIAPPAMQPQVTLQGIDLDRTRGLTLGESLKGIPGVTTIQTGPSISKPVIHGLHSNRVLVMNNGIRQEGQQWGSEHAPEIDPFIAKKINIVKGAAGVRYGADAIGGVVLLEPAPLPYGVGITGELNAVASTNNRQGVLSGIVQGGFPKNDAFSWRVQGTAKRAGNSHAPGYYLKNTGVSELNFSSAVGYRKEKFGAEFFYSQFNTKIGIFSGAHIGNRTDFETALASDGPLPEHRSGFSYTIGRPFQDINHYLLKGNTYYLSDKLGKFSLALGHQFNYRAEYDSHKPLGSEFDGPQMRFLLNTYTTDFTWEHKPIKGLLNGMVGINGMYQQNDMQGRFLIPDFTGSNLGIFVVERLIKSQWELEAGARYDVRRLDVDMSRIREKSDPSRTFGQVSGTIGATYKFSPGLSTKLNAGMGWRPPSVNELYSDGIHHGEGSYIKGDYTLQDETAYNITANLTYTSPKFQAEVDGYHYFYNNYIYQQPEFPGVLTIRGYFPLFVFRQTDANLSGIDLAATYEFSHHFSLRAKYSMVRATSRTTGDPLPFISPDRLQSTLRYHIHHWLGMDNIYISLGNVYVAKQWRLLPNSDYAPPPNAYMLFDAEVGFSVPGIKNMDVGVTVSNLLNSRYRNYLNRFRYYADEVGRNINFRIKYSF
jgi:iron complex outermembrane receptor protein